MSLNIKMEIFFVIFVKIRGRNCTDCIKNQANT